ncbi:MAG: hypothetical protein A2Y76_11970 [Planctomycetes bacterium RBG_13_60_9]|nr:MAG: hypothetical protein A2Y76_11970 [Planctomycetes bacterium RBG_13_60_9]
MIGRRPHTAEARKQGSAERAFILRALRCLILRESAEVHLPCDVDRDELCRLASRFGLEPILQSLLRPSDLSPDLWTRWQHLRMLSLRENARACRTVSSLFVHLQSAGISAAVMRGLSLAYTLYPDPSLRPMHDIDLLIKPEDAAGFEAALQAVGHTPAKRLRSQLVYRVDERVIEVHWSVLTAKRYRKAISPSDLLATRREIPLPGGAVLYVLAIEQELLALISHALVHHEMARMLSVIDIGLAMVQGGVDWDRFLGLCRTARLTHMAGLTLAFVNRILDLGCDHIVQMFKVPEAKARGFSDAYQAHLFGQIGLRHYLTRKRALFYMAETPARRFRQALRLFSQKEIRTMWAHVAGNPQPSVEED